MTRIAEPERVTAEEAEKRGFDVLLDEASRRPIAVTSSGNKVVFMVSSQVVDVVSEALEIREDLLDAMLVITRMLTEQGRGTDLEDVLEELGISQDDIDAVTD